MTPSVVTPAINMFYALLETASKESRHGGIIGPALFSFFNRLDIRPRWTTSPASTGHRFHHAFDGGLVVHTLEVFRLAQITADAIGEPVNAADSLFGWNLSGKNPAGFVSYIDLLTTVALHDLSKIGDTFGIPRFEPNMLKSGARSDKIPYATSDKIGKFATQAGPSVPSTTAQAMYLAEQAMEWVPDGVQSLSIVRAVDPALYGLLSDGVKFAIIHHDGAYGKGRRLLTGNETPLQMLVHFADMWSSRMNKEEYRG